jgi:hypothetical protein
MPNLASIDFLVQGGNQLFEVRIFVIDQQFMVKKLQEAGQPYLRPLQTPRPHYAPAHFLTMGREGNRVDQFGRNPVSRRQNGERHKFLHGD